MNTTDRAIDRQRALHRARQAAELMRSVPVDCAAQDLAQYCCDAMQNLSASDEKMLNTRVAAILSGDGEPSINAMRIGMVLMEYTGETLLAEAVERLKPEIADAKKRADARAETLDLNALAASITADDAPANTEAGTSSAQAEPGAAPPDLPGVAGKDERGGT
ncbi:MAG: hypothetical protein AAF675_03245 [Pseudomonadota bacterium]